MFQFSGFALPILWIQIGVTTKGSWVSPFGNPRVKACLLARRGLSQVTTSFFASYCLGIHRIRLVTWSYNPKTSEITFSCYLFNMKSHVTIEYTHVLSLQSEVTLFSPTLNTRSIRNVLTHDFLVENCSSQTIFIRAVVERFSITLQLRLFIFPNC